jgi:membrane-bound metal-dependent hydrolase YbcI (DUF457 family)
MEEDKSYAVGHFALGYIFGKTSAKFTKTGISIPIIFVLSVIPDIDIIIGQIIPFFYHRGPLHSIIILSALFIPVFAIYRIKAIPYFLALIQHPLLGDFITAGPVQLLWPVSRRYYGVLMDIEGPANVSLEWIAFAAMLIIMLKTKDMARFFQPHNSNLILAIPTFTVLLPTFLSIPLDVPVWLIPPHLFFIVLFLVAMFIDVRRFSLSGLKRQMVGLFGLMKR